MIIYGFYDLENVLQQAVALNNKAAILITRNKNDYKLAIVPVNGFLFNKKK